MTIRQQLERFVVERKVDDGHYEKVPLWAMVEESQAGTVAAERARIKVEVLRLEGQCHSHSGLSCDASPCVENVSREEVLAIVAEE